MDLIPRSQAVYDEMPRGKDFLTDPLGHSRDAASSPRGQWARPDEIGGRDYRWDCIGTAPLLGSFDNQLIGVHRKDDRHLITIAGTRGGKTSRVLKANLYTLGQSMIVLDPKGELATDTAKHRAEVLGHRVYILDPYGEAKNSGLPATSWDPLSEIDPASDEAIDDARKLADAICVATGKETDPHWIESARSVIAGIVLYVLTFPPSEKPSLASVREVLMLTHPRVKAAAKLAGEDENDGKALTKALFKLLQCSDEFDGQIAGAGYALEGMGEEERDSVISNARTHSRFLDSKPMKASLSGRPFRLADLKHERITLYLCLPSRHMAEQFRWMRVIVALALAAFERDKAQPKHGPILFLLEEFPTLGHMADMQKAASLLAGYGIRLWFVVQSIQQLKDHYGDGWETFIDNCGTIQAFNLNSNSVLSYLSQRLGSTTFWQTGKSDRSLDMRRAGNSGESQSQHTTALVEPAELAYLIRRRTEDNDENPGNQLIIPSDGPPRIVHLLRHETVARIKDGTLPEVAGLRRGRA